MLNSVPGERYISMQELPVDSRPRERLLSHGERALSTTELLAITLRTGNGRENALDMAQRLLIDYDGLPGIARATIAELTMAKGIGNVKAIEMKAALELGRRLATTTPEEVDAFDTRMYDAFISPSRPQPIEQIDEGFRKAYLRSRAGSTVIAPKSAYRSSCLSEPFSTASGSPTTR